MKTLILSVALVGSLFAAAIVPAQAANFGSGSSFESNLGGYGQTGRNYTFQAQRGE